MQPFTTLTGAAASLPFTNIDTDQIIPARFLKTVERTGLGIGLFDALRFDGQGRERSDFVLNQPPFRDACILVAGENFGCGSSREHAAWALLDFGIRCVIAPSFADIFQCNSFNNGLLAVTLAAAEVETLMLAAQVGCDFTVDLATQAIWLPSGSPVRFDISPARKLKLLHGLDAIGMTLQDEAAIAAHEVSLESAAP